MLLDGLSSVTSILKRGRQRERRGGRDGGMQLGAPGSWKRQEGHPGASGGSSALRHLDSGASGLQVWERTNFCCLKLQVCNRGNRKRILHGRQSTTATICKIPFTRLYTHCPRSRNPVALPGSAPASPRPPSQPCQIQQGCLESTVLPVFLPA